MRRKYTSRAEKRRARKERKLGRLWTNGFDDSTVDTELNRTKYVSKALNGIDDVVAGDLQNVSNESALDNWYSNNSAVSTPASFGTKSYYKSCTHNAQTPVMTFGKCNVYGGAYWDIKVLSRFDLAVDCRDSYRNDDNGTFPKQYEHLAQYLKTDAQCPTIYLPWRDHAAAPCKLEFWQKMYESLPDGNVVFYCVGGHGRTGTALAALWIIHSACTSREAIQYVRERHCKDAIETISQRNYLRSLAMWWDPKLDEPVHEYESKAAGTGQRYLGLID